MDKRAEWHRKPNFCDLIITETCMLKCKMCNMWQSKNDSESLEIDAWKRFIDSFADFVENKAQVQFVGGEPLIKKGLLDFIRHAAQRGLSTTMTTNGYLIDKNIANDIIGSGLSTLVFSLDSIRKETHDFLRGVNGTYDRVMNAIELLGKLRNDSLRIYIVTTIMQQNLDDLLGLAGWVNRNDAIDSVSFQAVMQPFFTPQDNEWYKKEEFLSLWPKDMDKVDYVLDSLAGLKNNGYKMNNPIPQFKIFKSYFRHPERFVKASRCNLGYNSVSVNTSGKIFLCLSMDPIGDIRNGKSMEEVWFSKEAERVRDSIKDCKNNCKSMINCFFEEEVDNA
ncbi:MAG: radical SAM protein [Candidatus Omnitrophica bacterium]|nr:radical SAM protein [Candidatus Omnitrophota bacterium]